MKNPSTYCGEIDRENDRSLTNSGVKDYLQSVIIPQFQCPEYFNTGFKFHEIINASH
jgi:hypothetical protein